MIKRGLLCRGLTAQPNRETGSNRQGKRYTAAPAAKPSHLFKQQQTWDISSPLCIHIEKGEKKSCASYYAFQSPEMGGDPCPYAVGAIHHPKSTLAEPSLQTACLPGFAANAVNLGDSRLSLTVGSSGSIWAPWSLISMFCNASGISTFLCAVFSVLHSARHSLCLVFGSGSSEAGGSCTLQLTRVTWLLLTRAASQVLRWMPWLPGSVREISPARYHCPHLATGIKYSLQRCKSDGH